MKKVLIFGAVEHAIDKAKELGYETLVIDQNDEIDCIKNADKFKKIPFEDFEQCLNFAKEQKVDGIVNATDFAVLVSSYVSNKMNLPGLDFEVAKLAKNKYEIRKKMMKKGITNVPQFFEIGSIEEIESIKSNIKFPVIIKPCSGLGSLHVYVVDNIEELYNKISEVIEGSFNKKALIETFIKGQEYGAESFVYEGKAQVIAVLKKNMTDLPYRSELGHSIPSELPENIEEKVKKEVIKLINAIGIDYGAVNMDLILTEKNEVYIIDVGARMGGNAITSHIIPNSLGIDHVGNIIKIAMGEKNIDLQPKFNIPVATRILDLDEGKILDLPDFSKYYKDKNVIHICFEKKVGDKIEKYVSDAQRCGFIVVKGENINGAKKNALDLRNKINKDIVRG